MFDPRLDSGNPMPPLKMPPPIIPKAALPKIPSMPQATNLSPSQTLPTDATKPKFSINVKGGVMKGPDLFRKDFRYQTQKALKPVLKNFADRSEVTKMLMGKRGMGGITKKEVRQGLNQLRQTGKLSTNQVRRLKGNLGAF